MILLSEWSDSRRRIEWNDQYPYHTESQYSMTKTVEVMHLFRRACRQQQFREANLKRCDT